MHALITCCIALTGCPSSHMSLKRSSHTRDSFVRTLRSTAVGLRSDLVAWLTWLAPRFPTHLDGNSWRSVEIHTTALHDRVGQHGHADRRPASWTEAIDSKHRTRLQRPDRSWEFLCVRRRESKGSRGCWGKLASNRANHSLWTRGSHLRTWHWQGLGWWDQDRNVLAQIAWITVENHLLMRVETLKKWTDFRSHEQVPRLSHSRLGWTLEQWARERRAKVARERKVVASATVKRSRHVRDVETRITLQQTVTTLTKRAGKVGHRARACRSAGTAQPKSKGNGKQSKGGKGANASETCWSFGERRTPVITKPQEEGACGVWVNNNSKCSPWVDGGRFGLHFETSCLVFLWETVTACWHFGSSQLGSCASFVFCWFMCWLPLCLWCFLSLWWLWIVFLLVDNSHLELRFGERDSHTTVADGSVTLVPRSLNNGDDRKPDTGRQVVRKPNELRSNGCG